MEFWTFYPNTVSFTSSISVIYTCEEDADFLFFMKQKFEEPGVARVKSATTAERPTMSPDSKADKKLVSLYTMDFFIASTCDDIVKYDSV